MRFAICLALAVFAALATPANAATAAAPTAPTAPAPAPAPPPLPYQPQLLRLAHLVGALAYLHGVCGDAEPAALRAKLTRLMDALALTPARRARMAGAYDEGFAGYAPTYRACDGPTRALIA
ncbi:MAG: TIGR02301 family protein, partial [Hyphomicrobiales bacterium]|nr:TIGR02301 family protein [Hyphomicrobiales bacterium]